ncbi:MAG: hypothetical protein NVSMB65_22440 [Chloroflexota bacterium]
MGNDEQVSFGHTRLHVGQPPLKPHRKGHEEGALAGFQLRKRVAFGATEVDLPQ